jgi:hypothetical protein
VIGYDSAKDEVLLNDPGHPDGRGMAVPRSDFELAWQDSKNFMVVTQESPNFIVDNKDSPNLRLDTQDPPKTDYSLGLEDIAVADNLIKRG